MSSLGRVVRLEDAFERLRRYSWTPIADSENGLLCRLEETQRDTAAASRHCRNRFHRIMNEVADHRDRIEITECDRKLANPASTVEFELDRALAGYRRLGD